MKVGVDFRILMSADQLDKTSDAPGKAGCVVFCACVLLLIYVFSVGPAAWLHEKAANPMVQHELLTVYAPVVFLINTTPLYPAGAWWIDKWVDVPESRLWLIPS